MEKIMIVLTDGSNVFGNNTTGLGSSYSSNGYLIDNRSARWVEVRPRTKR